MMMGWYLTSDVVSGEVEVAHIIPLPSPMSTFQGRECLEVERSVIWDVLNRYVPSLSSHLNSAEDVDRVDNAITLVPCLHTAFKKKKTSISFEATGNPNEYHINIFPNFSPTTSNTYPQAEWSPSQAKTTTPRLAPSSCRLMRLWRGFWRSQGGR